MAQYGRVSFKDKGLARIMSSVKELARHSVEVGLVGPEAEATHANARGLTVAEVGLINEFGSTVANVPERSFLRATFRNNKRIPNIMTFAANDVVLGRKTPIEALDQVGRVAAELVKQRIARQVPPANATFTVRRKGFDHPLIEDGELIHAISHRVVITMTADFDKSINAANEVEDATNDPGIARSFEAQGGEED